MGFNQEFTPPPVAHRCVIYTVQCTLCSVHYRVCNLQCTMYTVHRGAWSARTQTCVYTRMRTSYVSIHCILYKHVQYTCNVYFTLYTMLVQYTGMNTVHCILYNVHYTMYTVQCTLYTVQCHCTIYTVHCTLNSIQCTMYTVQCTDCTCSPMRNIIK